MAKKKKKSRASMGEGNDQSSSPATTTPEFSTPIKGSGINNAATTVADFVDLLSLRIVPSSTPPIKSLKYTPIIVLTTEDAERLDVFGGDLVFLLSVANNSIAGKDEQTTSNSNEIHKIPELQATALARVQVVTPSSAQSSSFHKYSPSSTKSPPLKSPTNSSQRSKLSSGLCHVFPVELAQRLQGTRLATTSDKQSTAFSPHHPKSPPPYSSSNTSLQQTPPPKSIPETPSSAPSITTTSSSSSSSKPKFSFAKGGGGDKLISTPKSQQQQQRKVNHNSTITSTNKLWIVPLDADPLGSELTELLCDTATKMVLSTCIMKHDNSNHHHHQNNNNNSNNSNVQSEQYPDTTQQSIDSSTSGGLNSTHDDCDNNHHHNHHLSKILRGKLGQQLIHAHLNECRLSQGVIVKLSVQGKIVPCQVTAISGKKTTKLDNLATQMSELTLSKEKEGETIGTKPSDPLMTQNTEIHGGSEKSNESNLLQSVRMAIQSNESAKFQLFQLASDTTITIATTTSDEPETKNEITSSSAMSPLVLVAGLDTTIERVQRLLTAPLILLDMIAAKSTSNGSKTLPFRLPKGVLVHGPSGCGKTSLCRQVAQRMQDLHHLHVQHVSCTNLQSQTALVGQAEKELVSIFKEASRRRPNKKGTLLVLDDIHLICPRRQGMNVAADRLSATLLALLDGVDGTDPPRGNHPLGSGGSHISEYYPLIVLAVTTNPAMLDPAVRRPGRLDAEEEVPLPDEPAVRSEILQFQLQLLGAKLELENQKDWLELARLAKGFTGADLQLAAKEAVRVTSIRKGMALVADTPNQIVELERADMELAIRSIKPSAIKAVTVEIPQVHWTNIGGMEDVKRQLRDAIELPLTHGAMFKKLGISPPRGVLLYGPPGCSKTLMARALATEGHMNFLAVKGPELLSKWLGESERALASLFRRARLASPSVIFFDEVDAIATKRSGGNSGGERLLSQLLTELDGIGSGGAMQKEQRVVVVCATNRPDLLDSALVRPGRIDRMIYVGVPDEQSRRQILEITLKGKACADDLDLDILAQEEVSGGLSGAELVASCRNAALTALEEAEKTESALQQPTISMAHMLASLKTMERQITRSMLDFYATFQGKSGLSIS